MTVRIDFQPDRNLLTIGGTRLVFHCHHYNLALQRAVDDALGSEGAAVQRAAAAEAAQRLLDPLFSSDGNAASSVRLERAAELFSSLGFGKARLALGLEGGTVTLVTSHYAIGYESKFGRAQSGVCYFSVGYWAGAFAAATRTGMSRIVGSERRCAAVEGDTCEIFIEVL